VKKRPLLLACVLVFLASIAMIAHADVVELKTGQRIEGTLKQATPASVSVEVGGQTITFEGEKVRAIYFGAASAAALPPSLRDDAMKTLKSLRSVVEGGVNYRDYATRMSDTKIAVDRYLAGGDEDAARPPIRLAMGFYAMAASAWNARITENRDAIIRIGAHPLVQECEVLKSSPVRLKSSGLPMFSVELIWSCAADKIAEAEKLIAEEKK
jgi:hypothetical protein